MQGDRSELQSGKTAATSVTEDEKRRCLGRVEQHWCRGARNRFRTEIQLRILAQNLTNDLLEDEAALEPNVTYLHRWRRPPLGRLPGHDDFERDPTESGIPRSPPESERARRRAVDANRDVRFTPQPRYGSRTRHGSSLPLRQPVSADDGPGVPERAWRTPRPRCGVRVQAS